MKHADKWKVHLHELVRKPIRFVASTARRRKHRLSNQRFAQQFGGQRGERTNENEPANDDERAAARALELYDGAVLELLRVEVKRLRKANRVEAILRSHIDHHRATSNAKSSHCATLPMTTKHENQSILFFCTLRVPFH
jgi:predicted metallopeptidase